MPNTVLPSKPTCQAMGSRRNIFLSGLVVDSDTSWMKSQMKLALFDWLNNLTVFDVMLTTTCCSIIAFNSCFFQFSGWIIAGISTCQLIKTESPEFCKPKSLKLRFDPRQLEISDLKKCKVLTPSTLGTLWEASGNLCRSRVLPPCGRTALGLSVTEGCLCLFCLADAI